MTDDVELGEGFALGLTAGMMLAAGDLCDREDCPRGE